LAPTADTGADAHNRQELAMKTTRIAALLGALALILAACGGTDSSRAVPQIDDGAAPAAPVAAADDEDHADDEAPHEDDADRMDDEAPHEDDADHADDEAPHEDEADHVDDDAGQSDEYVPVADGEPSSEFDVVLGDIFFESTAVMVEAGQTVRFNLANEGVIDHEFRLSNPHRIDEHIAAGHEDHGDTGHHEENPDIVVTLTPGETRSIDVTFPADTALFTEIACLIPGHYEAGMKAPITYQ
jgi:uncharacterized cupredoxin-like copper-binding protein